MTLSQILPAIALSTLSLANLPTTVDGAIDMLLDVPAISQALPDDVEAWLGDIEIGPRSERSGGASEPSADAEGTSMSRTSRTAVTKTRSVEADLPARNATKAALLTPAETISSDAKAELGGGVRTAPTSLRTEAETVTTSPKAELGGGRLEPARSVPTVLKPAPKATPEATKPARDPSAKSEPFGKWVSEQAHSGVTGRDLAEAIKAEKAKRK